MDTDGRVVRIDTISKIIAPGMRIGWITAPPDFVQKYGILQSQTAQFPSSVSQSVFLGLVNHWGEEGLHLHLKNVSCSVVFLFSFVPLDLKKMRYFSSHYWLTTILRIFSISFSTTTRSNATCL